MLVKGNGVVHSYCMLAREDCANQTSPASLWNETYSSYKYGLLEADIYICIVK